MTTKFVKGCIKEETDGMAPFELWFEEKEFRAALFDPYQIETRIKCEVLDLPGVYHYLDGEFNQVFDALS